MESLKDIRTRLRSINSTKKITLAMKMIAATRLRKAQEKMILARPYTDLMREMLDALIAKQEQSFDEPPVLLTGRPHSKRQLLVMMTSDRGLCGSFNSNLLRTLLSYIEGQKAIIPDVTFQFFCIGRKGRDVIKGKGWGSRIIETYTHREDLFTQARLISNELLQRFDHNEFDACVLFHSQFISILQQESIYHSLIPYDPQKLNEEDKEKLHSLYEFEPNEKELLAALLPRNFMAQIYRGLLETAVSEQAARMTSMDSATRNATDMIQNLTLHYNRTRQALVTKELIEIISGAEAL